MNFLILLLISGILADLREKIIEHLNDPVLLNSIAGKDRGLSSSISFWNSNDFFCECWIIQLLIIKSFILKLLLKTSKTRKKLPSRSFTGEVRKQVNKIRNFNPKAWSNRIQVIVVKYSKWNKTKFRIFPKTLNSIIIDQLWKEARHGKRSNAMTFLTVKILVNYSQNVTLTHF